MTNLQTKEQKIDDIIDGFVRNDVFMCLTTLIENELTNVFEDEAVTCFDEDDLSKVSGEYYEYDGEEYSHSTLEELRNEQEFDSKKYDEIDAALGNPIQIEVFDWWGVSSWLAEKLEHKGEIILTNGSSSYWGRQTSGQNICLDRVMYKIAEEINTY